jgi:hypothetical protein
MGLTDQQVARRKNKFARKAELVEKGLWQIFVDRRETLKGQGVAPPEAWDQAYEEVINGVVGTQDVGDVGGGDGGVGGGVGVDVVGGEGGAVVKKSGAPDFSGRVKREVFGDKGCSITRTVEWVAKMLMVEDPAAGEAPSMEAWSMLCWARRSNANEAQFWGQIWSKMMPSKQQLEAAERLSDDGSQVFAVIERVRLASESSRSPAVELEGNAEDGR